MKKSAASNKRKRDQLTGNRPTKKAKTTNNNEGQNICHTIPDDILQNVFLQSTIEDLGKENNF
jgi:hypothetical protein